MRKYILLTSTLLLLLGCETGVKNKAATNEMVLSGIVDRQDVSSNDYRTVQKTTKTSSNKIFSKSGQPGYYLQMGVFAKGKPKKEFLMPLSKSSFKHTVLNHRSRDYVLIGPYISYNSAKSKVNSVKSTLGKRTFVVQVLRP